MRCCRLPNLFLCLFVFLRLSRADVGTATYYNPPYVPATACYGRDESAFPANKLFAAASDGIWDNGAACGREYEVRCLSGPLRQACQVGTTIQVTVVDYMETSVSRPARPGSTLALSVNAFAMITNTSVPSQVVNVEFQPS
ncbi:hypothetical protein ACLOJK_021334 [Asimina triloba]